jgi:hypothetical protein
MLTVPRRFASMKDPVAPVLRESIDIAAALARLERRASAMRRRQRR